MKFNDEVKGTITHLDEKGRGTFGCFTIPFTTPNDEIIATFVKRDKGMKICRLKEITQPSPDRVIPPCPHAGTCGGCLWQHLAYDAQLRFKQETINRAFASNGHDERVDGVMASPETFFYRNRMDYAVGWRGEIGLKEYGAWNRYLDLSTCLLLDEETPNILTTVRSLMRDLPLAPWDAKSQTGLVRYVVIRLGKNTGERLVMLVVKDLSSIDAQQREEITRRLAAHCSSLYLGENPEITDLSIAKTLVLLAGNEFLTEEINGLAYRIHPNSFFQTNTSMAAHLQNTVLDCMTFPVLRSAFRVLDLYCGLGFFGIACARRGVAVYGHEIDAAAIELAKENARLNNVEHRVTFGAGPVEDFDWKDFSPDAVIVDPPRSGLHPRALQTLLKNRPPVIIYVSCNVRRLAEELKTLKSAYRVDRLTTLDLFPHTPHVESVARLVVI